MPGLRSAVAVAALLGLGLAAPQADAASQVLGLVASDGLPTPLQCRDGLCSAHLSSFCLQQARPAPSAGSEYELAPGGRLMLIAARADGSQIRVAAERISHLRSLIGFTSIALSVPQSELTRLGAVSVSVEVGAMTSLLPAPIAADPEPQTAEEIALATGPMRRLAEATFEARGSAADAARITSLLINLLPAAEPETSTGRETLWARLTGAPGVEALSRSGIAEAHKIFAACELSLASKSSPSVKSCMELHHADLMATTNRGFWNLGSGS